MEVRSRSHSQIKGNTWTPRPFPVTVSPIAVPWYRSNHWGTSERVRTKTVPPASP